MQIAGYQPLSLIDYPGSICSVVFTQGCPFKCPFCHNPELIPHGEGSIDEDTIFTHLDTHSRMLEGVCVTGGEPTIQAGLKDFLAKIKQRGLKVKLDTNGIHPHLVQDILDAKLVDFVAMDLKHTWEQYDTVTRTSSAGVTMNCKKTFEILSHCGIAHEFRTTVSPSMHSAEHLIQMASQLEPYETYALQQIRYDKMLDAKHPRGEIDLLAVAEQIRVNRPDLRIEVR